MRELNNCFLCNLLQSHHQHFYAEQKCNNSICKMFGNNDTTTAKACMRQQPGRGVGVNWSCC